MIIKFNQNQLGKYYCYEPRIFYGHIVSRRELEDMFSEESVNYVKELLKRTEKEHGEIMNKLEKEELK